MRVYGPLWSATNSEPKGGGPRDPLSLPALMASGPSLAEDPGK